MRKLLLSVAATALLATGAFAADVSTVPATYDSSGFDWDGFYAGVGITGVGFNPGGGTLGSLDLIAGVNMTSGDVLFGLEGWVGGYTASWGTTAALGGGEARIGYLVSPEALVYLSGGGVAFSTGALYGTVGAGVEFAVTDDLSVDLEYKYWGWSNNAFTAHSIGASANWHFN